MVNDVVVDLITGEELYGVPAPYEGLLINSGTPELLNSQLAGAEKEGLPLDTLVG